MKNQYKNCLLQNFESTFEEIAQSWEQKLSI